MRSTVLVATTSRWYPTARLSMAFAKAGFTVDAVCPSRHPLTKTKVLRRMFSYNGLTPLQSLAHAIALSKPDIVVPGDDLATRHLHSLYQEARYKGNVTELGALIVRSLGAPESFPAEYARTTFMDEARAEGIRVPRTRVIECPNDLKSWIAKMGLPVVLKANGTSGGSGVRMAHSQEEAEAVLRMLQGAPSLLRAVKRALVNRDVTLAGPALLRRRHVVNAQAFVEGREATSAVACWQGKVLAAIHFEVVKKRSSTGPATVVRLIENQEMSMAAERMARRLGLSGLHGFDFMLETQTGYAHLIEMNPRATQVGHLTLGPGRDIPAALYAAVAGRSLLAAPKVTDRDTIALFPQEWIRDPNSEFLRTAYHDVPWEEPELVLDCVKSHDKQRSWYSSPARSGAEVVSTSPTKPPLTSRAVGLD